MAKNKKFDKTTIIAFAVVVVFVVFLSIFLFNKKSERKENLVVSLVNKIRDERNLGLVNYGASSFSGNGQTQITTINCHVFNKAARTPVSGGTGDWMAMAESAGLAVVVGCSTDSSGLIRYETIRRGLVASWAKDIASLPENLRAQALNGPAGLKIAEQIATMPSMDMVCRQRKSVEARIKGRSTDSFWQIQNACGPEGQNTHEQLCAEAAYVIQSTALSAGAKDDYSWTAELFARYHRMSNLCTSDDKAAYIAFHSTVPREIFKQYGYRLSIAQDVMLNCAIDGTIKNIGSMKNFKDNIHYYRNSIIKICAKKTSFPGIYDYDQQPERITRSVILNGPWNYNPVEVDANPEAWRAGECGSQVASAMIMAGANPANPEALRRYCSRLQNKK